VLFYKDLDFSEFDFSDVKGRSPLKRCMEKIIATAGGHNIILIGPSWSRKRAANVCPVFATDDFTRSTGSS
jgi:predicted ATPase with chaperone activity